MRILMVTNTYMPELNGQALFTTNLAQGLVKLGHEVLVLVQGNDRPKVENRKGVIVRSTPALQMWFIHKGFFISWRYRPIVREVIESFDPQLVHLQDSAPVSNAVMVESKKRGVPILATHHSGPAVWAPFLPENGFIVKEIIVPIIWTWLMRYMNSVDGLVTPSRAAADMLVKRGLKIPVYPISCGVDVPRFKSFLEMDVETSRKHFGIDPKKKTFLYVGRLDEEKRVQDLIRSAVHLQNPEIQIVLGGEGCRDEEYRKLVKKLGVEDRVQFLGLINRDEVPRLVACCDVFIMPGDMESLSIATLEAMACSKPVIAANSMALPELVNPGENGMLFTPRNARELADRINEMVEISDQWPEMGKKSLERVEAHNLDNSLKTYEGLYQHFFHTHKKPWRERIYGPRKPIEPFAKG